MKVCKRCEERGKTWQGDEPKCGFPNGNAFTTENWNCATLLKLWEAADRDGFVSYNNDSACAMVPFDDGDNDGWIILTRYKCRGRITNAFWIIESSQSNQNPLTLLQAESALKSHD